MTNISPITFKNARVLIIGDIILDHYIQGSVSRISPEAPVPVLLKEQSVTTLGGAANVAANIAGLGASAGLIGVTGNDPNARELERLLTDRKIAAFLIKDSNRITTAKTRVMVRQHQLVRIDEEQIHPLSSDIEESVLHQFSDILEDFDAIILSDYGKGTFKKELCEKIISKCRAAGKMVFVDPKGDQWKKYRSATCITPNFREFAAVVGQMENEDLLIAAKAKSLRADLDLETLLVTRGSKGMMLVNTTEDIVSLPADAREVFDVSGAGDTVIACLAAARSIGWNWESSVAFANTAAGITVGKSGTKPVSIFEIMEKTACETPTATKILSRFAAAQKAAEWREAGYKVGFTNGCFDILHSGHIHLLHSSARMCDKLIVGLNSDQSITGLKGPGRPILSEEDRSRLIASIGSVDMVVLFGEPTPLQLIEAIKPDVLIKGRDYQKSQVVGADRVESWGGRVELVDLVENKSTTSIIEKIKKQ